MRPYSLRRPKATCKRSRKVPADAVAVRVSSGASRTLIAPPTTTVRGGRECVLHAIKTSVSSLVGFRTALLIGKSLPSTDGFGPSRADRWRCGTIRSQSNICIIV
jgi:hypothetical protein